MENTLSRIDSEIIGNLVINGDLSKLNQTQKIQYYNGYCTRLGLDPFTQPFKIIKLNGKEVLYCDRSGTQQLNKLHGISHEITSRALVSDAGVYEVTAKAKLPDGRSTESLGSAAIIYPDTMRVWNDSKRQNENVPHQKAGQLMKGDDYSNAAMKAETKAKRRATLDLLGLGILDETEVDTIPNAKVIDPELSCDDLKARYLILLSEYESLIPNADTTAMQPDNWKNEQTSENFKKAIQFISEKITKAKEHGK